jgi:hypothetical protein
MVEHHHDAIPYFQGDYLPYNFGHAALGFASVYMDPMAGLMTGVGFLVYEMLRDKGAEDRMGSIAEYATGYVLGVLFHG